VSVCGTVTVTLTLEVFLENLSAQVDSTRRLHLPPTTQTSDPDLPRSVLIASDVHTIETLEPQNFVPPSENYSSAGILTSSSIDYAATTAASP